MFRPFACLLAGLTCLGLLAGPVQGIDLKQRTVSSSGQFIVYSSDNLLRSRVASFAEELKGQWRALLAEAGNSKYPIVVTLESAAAGGENQNPVALSLVEFAGGFKVQVDVKIGADPSRVNLQKHLLRALFLEYAYRAHPDSIRPGQPFAEAPWWLVEGSLQLFRSHATGVDTDFYKRAMQDNQVPSLASVLAPRREGTEIGALQTVDQACAMCLVQCLIDQPNGPACLAAFVRHLPDGATDPTLALQRDFSTLTNDAGSAQKWWTLNIARLAAADRYKGQSPEETDAELTGLLQFEVPVPGSQGADRKSFGVADFDQYLKLPGSRPILLANEQALMGLSTRANAIYRSIVADYQQIFGLLVRGKTHGVKDRLAKVAAYRESLLRRKEDIADYLNWFEANKMDPNRRAFEGYIKAANELSVPARKDDPVTRYMDEISQEL